MICCVLVDMRPQKVDQKEVLEGMMEVLRAKGYDGTTLNDLANASGLQKASLYHRFPGGKEEIARAVLEHSGEWLNVHLHQIIADEAKSPEEQLELVMANIQMLYRNGESICILRSLSMDNAIALVGKPIKTEMLKWINSFTQLGINFGFEPVVAERMAYEGLIKVQGSLVVAKGLGNNTAFQQALISIKNMYLTP